MVQLTRYWRQWSSRRVSGQGDRHGIHWPHRVLPDMLENFLEKQSLGYYFIIVYVFLYRTVFLMSGGRSMRSKPLLVTGATGYVGGRLVPRLLNGGHRVRVMGRSLSKLQCRPWAADPGIDLVQADVMNLNSLRKAVEGCHAVFYLVHSMNPGTRDFAEADRKAARNMTAAADGAGVERIIYLGGLGTDTLAMSEHLRSRAEVANILQKGAVPTTFLRAAVILGSGSASFELLRYLVEPLPVMTTPRWVQTPCQPIAIRNVLNYLQGSLEHDETTGQTDFDWARSICAQARPCMRC